uniref:CBM20 domain-containing protein n=1 Tax=Chromera velia CCMP2878 TaxID=1169474 RepID=A0A0G4GCJ9_9ALVE|eukprot:Cvel_21329.t1-p1 / transcript=Cvel_21329.t1 / gene=Cvel_21329 / organism=Chromera_velia_CCMP2878 / gene_product=Zinc finger protein 283, putative / transcript_product=Zinc finger protein 283, putative / location=Cvel_scaffold1989:11915-14093(-) / protein_length=708 / sequence_SO=supercontig / SO=protein_coding / is_pseudo=false
MKGGIAFVAHCPEVRENQRVVVAGECPELGGWELGDALCMRPAPCGRPWWVSSEVEVNLSESLLGVSAEFAAVAGTEGRVGKVGVSELKFRLLAVPNDGEGSGVPNSDNLVSLEPLSGGDFRVVRLIGAPPLSDSSAVGERGDNTIHVGVEGGGEQQERELVGISVEWGVLESVQLALLPRLTNRQTEHSQRENDSQSETACPPRTEGIQVDARISESTNEQRSASGSSVCPSQSAVELCLKENEVHPDSSASVGVCNRPSADTNVTDNRVLSCHPPTSPHLFPRDCARGRRQAEDGQRAQLVPRDQKRRRSESGLTQVEADTYDQVGGCVGERKEGASWGGDGDVFREEKQRRGGIRTLEGMGLFVRMVTEGERSKGTAMGTFSACMDGSALSASCAGGVLCVSTVGSAPSAKIAEGRASASTAGSVTSARIAEGRAFASTADSVADARIVGGRASVSTADSVISAKSAGGRASASTADSVADARIAEGRASASTAGRVTFAKSAGGGLCVSTAVDALSAKSAGGGLCVSTAVDALSARSVGGRVSVSTAVDAISAKSVGRKASASTAVDAISAGSVEGRAFVSTAGSAVCAKSVGGRAFASTADSVADARIAEGRASASTAVDAISAKSVEGRASVNTAGNGHVVRGAGEREFVSTAVCARTAKTAKTETFASPAYFQMHCDRTCVRAAWKHKEVVVVLVKVTAIE